MSAAPLVTVLCAVHEESPYLDRALDGISAQTEPDFELLVVVDGGSEALLKTLAARAARESRLRVIRRERHGLTAALNHGLKEARGHYVARQDADDWSAPRRLEAQRRFLEEARAHIVSCHSRVVDEHGRLIALRTPPGEHELLRVELERYNCLPHSALFARRDALAALGDYRPQFTYTQDYDLYLRALGAGYRLRVLPEQLVEIRMTPSNITTLKRREQLGFALAAQADYFAGRGVSGPVAWRAMSHHWLRYMLPDPLRRAKRRVLEALR
ncbi:MAG: glycosyltransferase [Elusimicrobia bacterium]|nr:glycosyltransferase [Elusimicrobiota bacterium]